MNLSWERDLEYFEDSTLPILNERGKNIGVKALEGNGDAKQIIKYYGMLHRSFDPMTHLLLREAMEDYGCYKPKIKLRRRNEGLQ